jgi:hypothetical protein
MESTVIIEYRERNYFLEESNLSISERVSNIKKKIKEQVEESDINTSRLDFLVMVLTIPNHCCLCFVSMLSYILNSYGDSILYVYVFGAIIYQLYPASFVKSN